MSLGLGIVLFAIGAVLAFALNVAVDWINLQMVGYILMAAGLVVIILGIVLLARRRSSVMDEAVIEALKMENAIYAPRAGTVKEVCVKAGDKVAEDDLLVVIE